jgi:hypothetical protein
MKAYRQDFTAIASLVTDNDPARMNTADITKDSMRAAFATYASDHEAASIRRCCPLSSDLGHCQTIQGTHRICRSDRGSDA